MCVLCSGKQEILPKHFVHEQYALLVRNGESAKQKKKLSVFELQLVCA